MTAEGDAIVSVARRWIGTPYHHQASLEGVGSDCLGLVRGIWREMIGPEPEEIPSYSPHWAESGGAETLLDAARRQMRPLSREAAAPGDVLAFRMRRGGLAKHLAVLVEGDVQAGRIVHAYEGHAVCETALGKAWSRRIAGAFRFPVGET
ncbi:MAG: NlpC/P60 family protein [Pseudomonadota bacterium]